MAPKTISLTKGKVTIVDDADFEWLNQWRWHIDSEGYARRNSPYIRNEKRTAIKMHRLLMNAPKGMEVDHINGDRLDNRRCNLRICTKKQNAMNRIKIWGSSKYKGVSWYAPYQKWRASINIDGYRHLGYFGTEQEAAMAYNKAAKNMRSEFVPTNVI